MIDLLFDAYKPHARQVNFVLLVLIVTAMTASYIILRSRWTRRTRRIWFWSWLLFCNLAYATADNLNDKIRVNLPVVFGSIIFLGLFTAMVWTPDDDNELLSRPSLPDRLIGWLDRKIIHLKYRNHKKEI